MFSKVHQDSWKMRKVPCSPLRDKKDELLIEQELKETSAAHQTQMPPAAF